MPHIHIVTFVTVSLDNSHTCLRAFLIVYFFLCLVDSTYSCRTGVLHLFWKPMVSVLLRRVLCLPFRQIFLAAVCDFFFFFLPQTFYKFLLHLYIDNFVWCRYRKCHVFFSLIFHSYSSLNKALRLSCRTLQQNISTY